MSDRKRPRLGRCMMCREKKVIYIHGKCYNCRFELLVKRYLAREQTDRFVSKRKRQKAL